MLCEYGARTSEATPWRVPQRHTANMRGREKNVYFAVSVAHVNIIVTGTA